MSAGDSFVKRIDELEKRMAGKCDQVEVCDIVGKNLRKLQTGEIDPLGRRIYDLETRMTAAYKVLDNLRVAVEQLQKREIDLQLHINALRQEDGKTDDQKRVDANRAGYASGVKAGQDAFKSALLEWINGGGKWVKSTE